MCGAQKGKAKKTKNNKTKTKKLQNKNKTKKKTKTKANKNLKRQTRKKTKEERHMCQSMFLCGCLAPAKHICIYVGVAVCHGSPKSSSQFWGLGILWHNF